MLGQRQRPPRVVILTPVYNEARSLPLYEKAVTETLLSRPEYDFRVLFVEDGSTDESWAVVRDICARDPRFQGLRLSRNYGSHVALSAGFARADGDAVAILACDLQDPPEVVLEFAERWRAGAQVVWGHRRTREDSVWKVWASRLFAHVMRRFAMPRQSKFTTGSFLLVDRRVARCLRQFEEHNRSTFALVAWTGFEQAVVPYDRRRRVAGKSSWNFPRLLKSMYDNVLGFSYLPVRLMTLIGLSTSLLAFGLAAAVLLSWLTGRPVPGWSSLMLGLTCFFAVQFLLTGITGEYLYRIYAEVTRRPLFFVSDETEAQGESNAGAA